MTMIKYKQVKNLNFKGRKWNLLPYEGEDKSRVVVWCDATRRMPNRMFSITVRPGKSEHRKIGWNKNSVHGHDTAEGLRFKEEHFDECKSMSNQLFPEKRRI